MYGPGRPSARRPAAPRPTTSPLPPPAPRGRGRDGQAGLRGAWGLELDAVGAARARGRDQDRGARDVGRFGDLALGEGVPAGGISAGRNTVRAVKEGVL